MGEKRKISSLLKTFLPLRGFAILMVVLNHSAMALVASEANSLSPSLTPVIADSWQLVSFWKLSIILFTRFSVPLFLFLSGYNITRSPLTRTSIVSSIKKMLLPLIFWSLIAWIYSWRNFSGGWSILYLFHNFLIGQTQLGYYFIILLIQFFIISPFLVRSMKARPCIVFAVVIILQAITIAINYWGNLGEHDFRYPMYIIPRFLFSYSLGIWASINTKRIKRLTEDFFWPVAFLSIISVILLIGESGLLFFHFISAGSSIFNSLSVSWAEWTITNEIWAFIAILFFLGLFRRSKFLQKKFNYLGKVSFQIFLIHGMVITILTHFAYKYLGEINWTGFISYSIRVGLGILIPVIIIKIGEKYFPPKLKTLVLGL